MTGSLSTNDKAVQPQLHAHALKRGTNHNGDTNAGALSSSCQPGRVSHSIIRVRNRERDVTMATVPRTIYRPIKPYQTRLIHLHKDNGNPDIPLICDLQSAAILHAKFEGLLLRTPSGEDFATPYDALSYCWGNNERTRTVACNDVEFPITENLFQALKALRYSDNDRWLWVDAICINQSNNEEVSEQVSHMLQIYQKATNVVAWLGKGSKDDLDLIQTANSALASRKLELDFDLNDVYRAIENIYTRPWFTRIWIQQEVFAARHLRLQIGAAQFSWCRLLQCPDLLSKFPRRDTRQIPNQATLLDGTLSSGIIDQIGSVEALDKLHTERIASFEAFHSKERRYDLVEFLLLTSKLDATDPRDHVYGILGIADFPSRAMSIENWLTARQTEVFIPIDYSSDLSSINTAITWVLLMKLGLNIVAKFKVFAAENSELYDPSLPSWAIDWRLSSQFFKESDTYLVTENRDRSLERPWGIEGVDAILSIHRQLCHDNTSKSLSKNRIVLRGLEVKELSILGRDIWHVDPERRWLEGPVFKLPFVPEPTDIIVFLDSFAGYFPVVPNPLMRFGHPVTGYLWILRPAGHGDFKLVVCLADERGKWQYIHSRWQDPTRHDEQTRKGNRPLLMGLPIGQSFGNRVDMWSSVGRRTFTII